MIIIDTDVWVAFFVENDSQHAKAVKLFDSFQAKSTKIAIPEYVVIEVVTVLRRLDPASVSPFMDNIVHNDLFAILPYDSELFQDVCQMVYSELYPKLSFTDLSLVVLSQQYEVTSFDKALVLAMKKFKN